MLLRGKYLFRTQQTSLSFPSVATDYTRSQFLHTTMTSQISIFSIAHFLSLFLLSVVQTDRFVLSSRKEEEKANKDGVTILPKYTATLQYFTSSY